MAKKNAPSLTQDETLDALRAEITKALAPVFARRGFEGFAAECKASPCGATFKLEIVDPKGSKEVLPFVGLPEDVLGSTVSVPDPRSDVSSVLMEAVVVGFGRNPKKSGLVCRRVEDGVHFGISIEGLAILREMGLLPSAEPASGVVATNGIGPIPVVVASSEDGPSLEFVAGEIPALLQEAFRKSLEGPQGLRLPQEVREALLANLGSAAPTAPSAGKVGKAKPASGSLEELLAGLSGSGE